MKIEVADNCRIEMSCSPPFPHRALGPCVSSGADGEASIPCLPSSQPLFPISVQRDEPPAYFIGNSEN
jgi:hypothetical protein